MVGLAAVTMLFVTFTATYMFRHSLGTWDAASSSYVNDWQPLHLPLRLLLLNTAVLLLSSVTMEQARKAAFRAAVVAPIMAMPGIARERGRAPWIPITPALGLCFLGGQYLAWREMARRGFFLATGPSSSFFYVLTALHAVHLLGGIIALSYAVAVTFRPGSLERRRIAVDVTAWYWHFMAVLWVYILVLLVLTT
jgi:cytochrome c oxidase subunit 3